MTIILSPILDTPRPSNAGGLSGTTSGGKTQPAPTLTPPRFSKKTLSPQQRLKQLTQIKQQLKQQKPMPLQLEPLNDSLHIHTLRRELEPHRLKPGFPIPSETMKLLLKYLKSFGVHLSQQEVATHIHLNQPKFRP